MDADRSLPVLTRLPTGVPGLDAVLGGGLLAGDAYLVAGDPGTGKTTLGNQLAFAHAAAGGTAVVATLRTETHDRMLAHLGGFGFADAALVGERLFYLSLLDGQRDGVDGVLDAFVASIREHRPGLAVLDGTWSVGTAAAPGFDHGDVVRGLRARAALRGCTVVLLAGRDQDAAAAHVDGVLELSNETAGSRDVRLLRVAKLRGSAHLDGHHRFVIGSGGVVVSPRLEASFAATAPAWQDPVERLAFGVEGLDAMLGGGLPVGASAMLLGTPGAGKTLFGLHFLAEGARRGEAGLIAGFQETAPALASTADRMGLDLGRHIATGLVRVLWRPPLELSPDAWAWELLAAVDGQGARRVVIDALTDLLRLFADAGRRASFLAALTNALRDRGVTALYTVEIDELASPVFKAPLPGLSAAMDAGILLRVVELESRLGRLASILKVRQSTFDPAIREFIIEETGVTVGEPFRAASLLTGTAVPTGEQAPVRPPVPPAPG